MTGLNLETDALVEIAIVVTDAQLNPLAPGLDLVIRPPEAAVTKMNSFVRQMHTTTNLIHEWNDGITLAEAQQQALAYIKELVPDAGKAPLGGNSVGTDRMFLTRDMPELVDYLHYRIIDVSSVKELAKRWYPRTYFASPEKTGNHRALGDIYDSIDELRYYRDILFPAGEGPTTSEAKKSAEKIKTDSTKHKTLNN